VLRSVDRGLSWTVLDDIHFPRAEGDHRQRSHPLARNRHGRLHSAPEWVGEGSAVGVDDCGNLKFDRTAANGDIPMLSVYLVVMRRAQQAQLATEVSPTLVAGCSRGRRTRRRGPPAPGEPSPVRSVSQSMVTVTCGGPPPVVGNSSAARARSHSSLSASAWRAGTLRVSGAPSVPRQRVASCSIRARTRLPCSWSSQPSSARRPSRRVRSHSSPRDGRYVLFYPGHHACHSSLGSGGISTSEEGCCHPAAAAKDQ
jgi:hypothetical protein